MEEQGRFAEISRLLDAEYAERVPYNGLSGEDRILNAIQQLVSHLSDYRACAESGDADRVRDALSYFEGAIRQAQRGIEQANEAYKER